MFFMDKDKKDKDGEMILSKNVSLSMDGRKTRKNCNVLVVGSGGRQREAHYILPNLMQHNCSYVVMDDTAAEPYTIQAQTEQMFRDNGYDIKVFNVISPESSLKYNPFVYIHDDADVLTVVEALTKNFDERSVVSDSFELQRYRSFLLQAIFFYLYKDCNPEGRTLANVLKLLECADNRCEYEEVQSILDIMMSDLKKKDPEHLAVKQYDGFLVLKQHHPEAARKVIIDAQVNLALLRIQSYSELTNSDELNLADLGMKPTVLYIKYSSRDPRWGRSLVSLLVEQLFKELYYTAETKCERFTLPTHVRMFFDHLGFYGVIKDFSQKLATMRKYNISCNILTRNLPELKYVYPDEWEVIVGNCDTVIYLADTNEVPEFFTKMVEQNGRPKPRKFEDTPATIQKGAKPLTAPEQLNGLKRGDCAVFIRGCVPIVDRVSGLVPHPNDNDTADDENEKSNQEP